MTVLKSVKATSKGGPLTKEMQIVNWVEELQYLQAHPTPQQILGEFDHYIYRATGFHPTGTNANAIDSTFYISDDNQLANLTNTGAVNLLVAPKNYPSSYQSMRLASLNGDDDYMGWVIGRKETSTHLTFLIAYVDLQPATGAKLALMTQTVDKSLTLPNDDTYTEDNMPAYVTSQKTLHSQIYPELGASHNATPAKQGWLTPPWPNGMPVESVIQDGNVDIKWYHPQTKALLDHWVFSTTAMPDLVDMEPCSGLMNCSQIEGRWYDYITAFAAPDVYVVETGTVWRLDSDNVYKDTGTTDTEVVSKGRFVQSSKSPVGQRFYRHGVTGAFEPAPYDTMVVLDLEFDEAGVFEPRFSVPENIEIDWGNDLPTDPPVRDDESIFYRYSHAYEPGKYRVTIKGKCQTAILASPNLTDVIHWGNDNCWNMKFHLSGGTGDPVINSTKLVSVPMFLPAGMTSLSEILRGATLFSSKLNWVFRNVNNVGSMFRDCESYNHPLDLSTATNIVNAGYMLAGAKTYNSPINFGSAQVRVYNSMLAGCEAYNQPLNFDFRYALQTISAFAGCTSLEIHNLTLDAPLLERCDNMFEGCKALTGKTTIKNTNVLKTANYMFSGCSAITEAATIEQAGALEEVEGIYKGCSALVTFVPFGTLTPPVKLTNVSNMLEDCVLFNGPVDINTQHATKMARIFSGCTNFNSVITLDFRSATTLSGLLSKCENYNLPLDLSAATGVLDVSFIFNECKSFNSALQMSTSLCRNFSFMFSNALVFDQPVQHFGYESATNMNSMFNGASNYNKPFVVSTPNLQMVMSMMAAASSFNSAFHVDTGNCTNMGYMFSGARAFNQPLNLDSSNCTSLSRFMMNAVSYNQPLNLDTSKCTNMESMFRNALSFNQALNFDTSACTRMAMMFMEAAAFNQDLSHWCVTLITAQPEDFDTGAVAWTLPRPVWGTCPAG